MIVIEDIEALRERYPFVVATVGIFDGVHLAHQKILGKVLERARAKGGISCVYTFANHPLEVLNANRCPKLITPPEVKREIARILGIDLFVSVKFTPSLANTPPREFVEEVLVKGLNVKEVCVGFNFTFGKDRKGTAQLLFELGKEYGFEVEVVPPVRLEGSIVSSTLIRELLKTGQVREAARFLGRPYLIKGRVERGAGRGKSLGYPTANLAPFPDLLVPDGVYAGRAALQGRLYDALINVGGAPTFGEVIRRVEVHLLDSNQEIYGEELSVFFVERIREERVFPDAASLREQIGQDERRAREALAALNKADREGGDRVEGFRQ